MYYFIIPIVILLAMLIIRQSKLNKENDSDKNIYVKRDKRKMEQRIFDTLVKMQCQPKKIEDSVIHFGFQGQQFQFAIPSDGSIITRLWYPGVGAIDVDSPYTLDTFETINTCKQHSQATILIGEPEEDKRRYIHIFFDMVAHHEITDLDGYILFALNECFKARQALEHFTETKANNSRKNRRTIGFTTPEQANQETTDDTADSTVEYKTENSRRTVGFSAPKKTETAPAA